jgi:hypothetical protein
MHACVNVCTCMLYMCPILLYMCVLILDIADRLLGRVFFFSYRRRRPPPLPRALAQRSVPGILRKS